MRLTIRHETGYQYDDPVSFSAQYLRLTPYANRSQSVLRWHIGAPGRLSEWRDAFGNLCHTLIVDKPVDSIRISATGVVETIDTNGVLPDEGGLPIEAFLRTTPQTEPDGALRELAGKFADRVSAHRLDGLHALMGAIRDHVDFQPGGTHVHSTAAEAFADRVGVCQDHAHVFLACCRTLGVPARYVSGYLYTGEQSEPHVASHAWAAAWADHLGWVSFDVANTISATERHVGVAIGFDYASAAPIRGIRHGGDEQEYMNVAVDVSAQQQ